MRLSVDGIRLALIAAIASLMPVTAANAQLEFKDYQPSVSRVIDAPNGIGKSPDHFVWVSGSFEPGDEVRFKEYIRDRVAAYQVGARPLPSAIIMDSPGGDLRAALIIGSLIRNLRLSTYVGYLNDRARCASACFFAFVGGINRMAMPNSSLEIHRPYFDGEWFGLLDSNQAENTYTDVTAVSQRYLESMGVPRALLERMFTTPSSSSYALTSHELETLTYWAPFFDEMLISLCGGPTEVGYDGQAAYSLEAGRCRGLRMQWERESAMTKFASKIEG